MILWDSTDKPMFFFNQIWDSYDFLESVCLVSLVVILGYPAFLDKLGVHAILKQNPS